MIRLFDRDETNFDHNETPLPDVLSAIVEVEANGMYELVLEYPRNAFAKTLTAGKILKAPTPDGEQLFRIYKPIKNLKTYRIYARHIFYDLLKNFIENVRPTTTSGSLAIASILGGTAVEHNFTGYSDIPALRTANYVRMSPIEALLGASNSFLSVWGGELTRDNFNFRIDAQGGRDRGYEVRLGKNLIGIEADIDETNIFTCIYPTVVIEGNVVTTLPEKYVYSPLVNNYESTYVIEERIELLDEEKELPLESIYTLMRNRSALLFEQGADKPEVNYKVDFVELSKTEQYEHLQILEQLNLYDTVDVIVDELDIRVKAKTIKYTYDALRERYESMELGNFKQSLASQAKNTLGMVEKQINQSTNVIREAFELSNDLITGNLGGHIITRRNAEGLPYEQLIMDTDDIQTATNVIRMNQQGIGFSNTGYNGPFGVAITIDGRISVENLYGNTSNFVQSAWNAIGAGVSIDAGGFHSTKTTAGITNEITLSDGQMLLDSNASGVPTKVLLDGQGLEFTTDAKNARMRFNGTNLVLDANLGLFGNHINSVSWIRMIGGYETVIHKNPYDVGGALVDSTKLTIGLGIRDDFETIASFYGRIDFQRNLHLNSNNIQSVSSIGFDNSSTLLTPSIGNLGGGALIDGVAITIGQRDGSTRGFSRIAEFYGQIHFHRNVYMNGNEIFDTSDERMKHDIRDTAQDSLNVIDSLKFKDFYWNSDELSDSQQLGILAQEAHDTLRNYNEETQEYGVSQTRLVNTTAHGLQQLSNKVKALELKLEGLQ